MTATPGAHTPAQPGQPTAPAAVATDRWGITVPLTGLPLAGHQALLAELAAAGYTDAWTAETAGTDAFTPLALAAQWAPSLRLGTAIAPVYTRGPGLLAMSAATVAELAPGRFTLGIGTSSPVIVHDWNAAGFDEPYRRIRDTLRFLRAALSGAKVTEKYDTFAVRGFRLERPPPVPPRIVLAALRPGMLRLAAREADGAITNWLAPEDVPQVRAELAAAAGRGADQEGGAGPELVARIFVCPSEDAAAVRQLGKRLIAGYLTVEAYAEFQRWLGRGDALAGMNAAWAAGDRRGAAAAVPDEVVDALIVHGSPDACRARIREYTAKGVTTPVLALLPTGDPAELPAAARALAPA
jgi:probable F420-dependent oxidoreductase